jgi:hypothetical protein
LNYLLRTRVARWQILKPKIRIWANWALAIEAVGIFYGQLVYFMVIWYIFSRFGVLYQEKSGNPVEDFCHLTVFFLLK